MDIRRRIQHLIDKDRDLTVRNVSLAAGLSDSYLGKFLKGDVESLTLKTVDKLAEALDVDARWLAYGEGDPERFSDISAIWERIHEEDRERARAVLAAFARTGTDG